MRSRILQEMVGERGQTKEEMAEEKVKTEKMERERRVRGLKTRLGAIETLKEKEGRGEKLQPNQLEKVESEDALKRELEDSSGEVA